VSDQAERQLFFASTSVHIGNGRSTPFWEVRWLHGAAPKDLASSLYRLARFKHRSVFTELSNSNWISSLVDITTTTEMEDFTLLFMVISLVSLTDQLDTITWRWTGDGKFTVASAYKCQFHGTYTTLPATKIWKCFVEPKVRFFLWLVLHDRLTADNMLKKNWPCNQTCSLCFCMDETTTHLLMKCKFLEAAWNMIAGKFNLPAYVDFSLTSSPSDWVRNITSTCFVEDKESSASVVASLATDLVRLVCLSAF
jgi:hypothetical protein